MTAELVLYTDAYRVAGQVDPGGRRLSDWLNERQADQVVLRDGAYQLLSEERDPVPFGLMGVPKIGVDLVVPLDPPNLGAQVATERVALTLAYSLYTISGMLHRRSSDPRNLASLLAGFSRRFVPISVAEVRCLVNPHFDADVSVVLANIERLKFWCVSS